MPFLQVSVKMLAECPLGSFAMLLLDASLKIANTQADLAAWVHGDGMLEARQEKAIRRPEE